jgi:hypothetical protein
LRSVARCACFYPIRQDETKLGLSEAQLARLERLRLAELQKQSEDVAVTLDVLDDTQKIKLAAFEGDLRLLNEAMDIGLLTRPVKGEVLCN